jgi:hypothetical protein
VTPTYYVTCGSPRSPNILVSDGFLVTFCTLVTSVILYQGLKASARIIITVALAFLVICTGITILQMSKVDPRKLTNVRGTVNSYRNLADHSSAKVDEHTTLLLEVAKQEPAPKASRDLDAKSRSSALSSPRRRRRTMSSRSQAPSTMPLGVAHSPTDVESGRNPAWDAAPPDNDSSDLEDEEVIVEKTEQPGIDSLRGTFGAVGTIIRNRRRTALAEAHSRSNLRNRRGSEASGLASQSINEEPRQPGGEKDPEKLDLGRKHFGSRITSEPTASTLPSAPPRDALPQGTPSMSFSPSSSSPALQPVLHSSPESEKSDPLASPTKRAPALHAHFDPNQQSRSSRPRTASPPPASNGTASKRGKPFHCLITGTLGVLFSPGNTFWRTYYLPSC